jgi:hypothetical protein
LFKRKRFSCARRRAKQLFQIKTSSGSGIGEQIVDGKPTTNRRDGAEVFGSDQISRA